MSLSRRRLISHALFLTLCALVTAIVITSARAKISRRPPVNAHAQDLSIRLPHHPMQVVRFTLYDVGIVPQTAYAQPGLVTIAVEDLSGGTTGLVIDRVDYGEARMRAGEVHRKENKRRGQEELALAAGRYQLYMADRPENRAELIIEP